MPTVSELVEQFESSSRERQQLGSRLKEAKKTERRTLAALRASLREGDATTGDPVLDIAYLGEDELRQPTIDFLRKVEQKIRGNVGKLVVSVTSHRGPYGEGDSELVDYHSNTIYGGILTDDTFHVIRKHATALLSMDVHLFSGSTIQREDRGPVWLGIPAPKPHYVWRNLIFVGEEVQKLYAMDCEFREYILQNKGKPHRDFLDPFPVPALQLA